MAGRFKVYLITCIGLRYNYKAVEGREVMCMFCFKIERCLKTYNITFIVHNVFVLIN